MRQTGHAVLITGAAGGLGSALALQCARRGANLVLLDKNRQGLCELSDRISDSGCESPWLYPMDLSGAGVEAFDELAQVVQAEFGGMRALGHCAAEFKGLQLMEQVEPHDWLECIQVNVNAPWLLTCTCLPLLKMSEAGRVIFLLDDMEVVGGAYWGAYGTAKAALTGMVGQFADALAHTSVSVHGVNPGPMRTPLRARAYHAEEPSEVPVPERVADRISDMLFGDVPGHDLMVDLSTK
jgi:NAD(P)-dependent dehydrogenase (short-subunit alcohol dehydrogenase family)